MYNNNREDRGPRQMYKATCSKCGKECEVPFKPMPDKEIYCRGCYAEVRNNRY